MGEHQPAPKDYQALRALIAQRAEQLPKRLTQVAAYALENPDEVAFGTVASIAGNAEVQPSALVRFSRALGYQGFSDLQEVFRSRLRERVLNYDERLAQMRDHGLASSRTGLMLDGFLTAGERSLAELRDKVDQDALERAVGILASAETIYLIGLRRSFPVTSYMSYAMGKLGIRNILVDAIAGLGAEQTGFIGRRDAVLATSFTPYASETVSLTAAARARGARIVSVTDSVFSPIASSADVLLEIAEANFEGFRSMAATLALAMTLTVAVAGRRGKAAVAD
ncbi:MAG: MurR/RpiR family transcriptional regulator [Mesorhizobium sp.]